MSLPIDRTNKAALDSNLVNGNTSDAPAVKNSNDVVYNTIDELYNYAQGLVNAGILTQASVTPIANKIAQRDGNGNVVNALPVSNGQNPNLLFNPSFNLGIKGWTDNSGGKFTFGIDTAVYKNVCYLNVAITNTLTYVESTSIQVNPNAPITISGLISASGVTAGSVWIEVHAYNGATDLGVVANAIATNGTGYTKYTASGTAPANTTKITVRLVCSNATIGAFGLDFTQIKLEIGLIATTFSDDNTLNTVQNSAVLGLAQVLSGGNKMQSGSATFSTSAAAGNYGVTITFPIAFAATPVVVPSITGDNSPDLLMAAVIGTKTATTVQIFIRQTDAIARTIPVDWIAIGT